MPTRLIGLRSDRTTANVLVTRLNEPANNDTLTIGVVPLVDVGRSDPTTPEAVRTLPVQGWRQTPIRSKPTGPGDHLHWAKPVIEGLEPGTAYQLSVTDGERPLGTATITTAPADDERHLRLLAGSCFDVKGRHTRITDLAYNRLVEAADPMPTYNLWLGDQVYVDAPWRETITTAKSRSIIFDRYLLTWGLRDRPDDDVEQEARRQPGVQASERVRNSLHGSMARTSNWFLPDDHEFWNGYPNPGWLTLFTHALRRSAKQVLRFAAKGKAHPAAQGEWGSAAGEAYALFASPIDFGRFTEDVSPEQIQVFGTASAAVVLVDTRWHRTIRKKGRGASFMLGEQLDDLVRMLREDERLICLALSRPIVGHLPHRGVFRRKVEYGPEDFAEQYKALWRALADRRAAGRSTLVVAGDVHHHSVSTALEEGLLEVVSSPLSLLKALDGESGLTRVRQGWKRVRGGLQASWRGIKRILRRGEDAIRREAAAPPNAPTYPVFDDTGEWTAATGQSYYRAQDEEFVDVDEKGERVRVEPSGIMAIDIHSDEQGHTVTIGSVLGFVRHSGRPDIRREDWTFRWDNADGGIGAWRKQ